MGKLFHLKEWLTLEDAAKYLSLQFGEDVGITDILQLAIGGHLRLSVHFVNAASARKGQIIGIDDIQTIEYRTSTEIAHTLRIPNALYINDDIGYLRLDERISTLPGVWDLPMPMVGAEKLDVEHYYQQLVSGQKNTSEYFEGAFVIDSEGQFWQLQKSFDQDENHPGSKAHLDYLIAEWEARNMHPKEAEVRFKCHAEDREKYLAKRNSDPVVNDYYPTNLPKDSVFVVRTKFLREFEKTIANSSMTNQEVDPKPQSKVYELLKAFVDLNYSKEMLDDLKQTKSKRLSEIKIDLEAKGYKFDDKTLRTHLKNLPD